MSFNFHGAVRASLSLAACAQLFCTTTVAAETEPLSEVVITATRTPVGVAQLAVPLVVDVGVGPNWEKAH